MSQIVTLKNSGLSTYPNQLSAVSGTSVQSSSPQGSLQVADDVIINRDNVIEPRRGFAIYGTEMGSSPSTDFAHQLFSYKTRLLRHYGTTAGTTVEWDDGSGNFTAFSIAVAEVVQGIRVKYAESNGNLYLTSSGGIESISCNTTADFSTAPINGAGIPEGLDLTVSINQGQGFFNQENVIAYRGLWGKKDLNQNLLLGSPSNRVIISNPLTNLLVNDFNFLLTQLDTCVVSTGIHSQNYASFVVAKNAAPSVLRSKLIALTAELDSDIESFTVAANVTKVTGSTSGATITVSPTGIKVGQQVSYDSTVITVATVDGTTTTTSPVITSPSTTTGVVMGQIVTTGSAGILLPNTTVVSVVGGTSITLSSLPLVAGTYAAEFNFTNPNPFLANTTVTGISGTTITVSPATIFAGTYTSALTFSSIYTSQATSTIVPSNTPGTSTNTSTTGTSYNTTVVLTANPTPIFQTGDPVILSGIIPTSFNTTGILQQLTTNTVTYNTSSNPGTYVSGTGTLKRNKYSYLTQPLTFDVTPFTNELLTMQVYYDAIVNILQVEPSAIVATPAIFDNSNSTQTATVNITFPIPAGITTNHFIQLYRTQQLPGSLGVTLASLDPGDEEYLAYEVNPTSTDLSNGFITIQDIEPDSYLGATLYTNANSGQGILQANIPPPLAQDLALYKNYMFYANTTSYHSKTITLLSVSKFVSGTSTFKITTGSATNTYTFVSGVAEALTVATVADVSGSLNSKYFTLNSAKNATGYYVWYSVAGAGVDPAPTGLTGIKVSIATNATANTVAQATFDALLVNNDFNVTVSTNTISLTNSSSGPATSPTDHSTGFTLTVVTTGAGENPATQKVVLSTLPTPAQQIDESARSLVNVINRNASEVVYAFYESGATGVPGQILLQARNLGSAAFFLTVNNTNSGSQYNPVLPVSGNSIISDNDARPNRVFFAKQYQPDAVPIVNYFDIGPRDKKILRIVALRQSLFVFKEEGIYRVTGAVDPFAVDLFDSSTILHAPDSAAVLNNTIYGLTNQGVVTVSDTGVQIISRPIEGSLIKLNVKNYPYFFTATWGIGYESDRTYSLWTVTNPGDTKPTQCYTYNTITSAWTRKTKTANCGVINFADDKMYVGATDTNFIEQERKNFDRTDYADRQYDFTLGAGAISGTTVTLSSVTNVTVGDAIVQVQYLTNKQFNRLLIKLDGDAGLATKTYESLTATAGVNLRTLVTSLATMLDADANTGTKTYASSITAFTSSFSDTQLAFNVLIGLLNTDSGTRLKNYTTSTGTVSYETVIISLTGNSTTTPYPYPFIQGLVTVYNHINTVVQWSNQTMGDPSMSKQVSEATLMFEKISFTDATISFSTDLNPGFITQDFPELGNGCYGNGVYGATVYGDSGNSIPLRTYVPRDMQRCRFINIQFNHATARESYAIFGGSLTYVPISQRAWK